MTDQPKPPEVLRVVSFTTAYLVVSIAALVVVPPANWGDGRWPRWEQLALSWTAAPTWNDGDYWFTNYVFHPFMGMLLYSFARHGRFGVIGAALFGLAASCAWEYGLEGWFEQPSWVDLLITPTAGGLLGEARWRVRARLLPATTARQRAGLAVLAPVYLVWLSRRRARSPSRPAP